MTRVTDKMYKCCHDITIYASFHGNDVFMHAYYREFGHW